MKPRKPYMPTKDADFLAWAKTIYKYCEDNVMEWQLDMTLLGRFGVLLDTADDKFRKNSDKSTKNRESVLEKNAAFAALKAFLQLYTNLLEGNENIPDQSIEEMGLHPRHRSAPHPHPVPTENPVLVALTLHHYEVDTYASTLQHGHPTEFLSDETYGGYMLRYKLEGDTEWKTVISTKLHYTLVFTEEEVGKRITLQAAWVNTRMQPGPWSDEVFEIIT
ncbi:MAG: hypothetical protein LBG58_06580 [Planctomycetaceae bacterium]|jgi:hypothetical protein|nr:hypothetical protein [Planctomycetaceae bacterium]